MQLFDPDLIDDVKTAIDKALYDKAEPYAAFDADGTLWACDLGENFFNYQIENQLLPNLPEDPWAHYKKLKSENPEKAYLWLAQINEGIPLEKVQTWASRAADQLKPIPTFDGIKEIIFHLQKKKVNVFIVTASIAWAVEPAAHLFDIPVENVIGIRTKIIDGKVGTGQDGPITYRQGKVRGIKAAANGKSPFFAAGNTEGDLPLLQSATHVKLVVASSPAEDQNYETERKMLGIAKERDWFSQDLVLF